MTLSANHYPGKQFKAHFIPTLCFVVVCALLSGCIGSREVEAPAVYLSPAGWQNNQSFLEKTNFSDYASAVTEEVQRFRIPFDAERADVVSFCCPGTVPELGIY